MRGAKMVLRKKRGKERRKVNKVEAPGKVRELSFVKLLFNSNFFYKMWHKYRYLRHVY